MNALPLLFRLLRPAWRSALVLLGAAMAVLPAHAQSAVTPEARLAAKTAMQSLLKCWETGDRATFASLLHPDLVFGYPGGRMTRDKLLQTFDEYPKQKKDIKIYFSDKFITDGSKSVLTYQFAATDRVTGKRFAVGTAVICQFSEGKIIALREYWDTYAAEQQKLGELPLDEGQVSPWPISVWLRADRIN